MTQEQITPGTAEGDLATVEQDLKAQDACTDNPVGWFELPVQDMERARGFYQKVFGYSLEKPTRVNGFEMSVFPMKGEGTGAAGSLMKGPGYTPSHEGALIYFSVPDIPPVEKKIALHGGKVHKPKFAIGEHGFISICEDTEGNRIALHARK